MSLRTTMMIDRTRKPSFVRLFAGGFVLGAACVVAVQAAHADPADLPPVAAAVVGALHG